MTTNAKTTKPGTVKRIVPSFDSREPDKAEIHVHDTEPLYEELRIPNSLTNEDGEEVKLKKGAEVEVHIEANKSATTPKEK
jgi:hypothetical protein